MQLSRDDRAFLATYDPNRYERPSLAVDVVALTVRDDLPHALVIRRADPPQRGRWALPGVFVGIDETLEDAADRALSSKVGITDVFLEQLYTFALPDRDPRLRVVSVVYYALVPAERLDAVLGPDTQLCALSVPWDGEEGGAVECIGDDGAAVSLAFDHAEMIGAAVKRLRGKVRYAPVGLELLPEQFRLRDLQGIHEAILGHDVNKDSFRQFMLRTGWIEATGERERSTRHRPAQLYRATGA